MVMDTLRTIPTSINDTPSVSKELILICPVGLKDLGLVAPPIYKVTLDPALIPLAIKYLTPDAVAFKHV
jgi:hypothetical protein